MHQISRTEDGGGGVSKETSVFKLLNIDRLKQASLVSLYKVIKYSVCLSVASSRPNSRNLGSSSKSKLMCILIL